MSTTDLGREAEKQASIYLEKNFGFDLIERNWRNRFGEIDIVMMDKKTNTIHFIEVKYRKSIDRGDGLNYITNSKQKQMVKAAKHWLYDNEWDGDFQIDAMSVTKQNDEYIFDYIENITMDNF